jgi:hypothetical protein
MAATFLRTQVKTIRDYPSKGDFKWHRAAWRFRFYDNQLNPRVRFARHALAIDETRQDFKRVPWASKGAWEARLGEPEWLKQVWFAGNHSDVGGSYPEDEARLSDITLAWMVEEAQQLPHPIRIDKARLNLFPDASGLQHCEVESMLDGYPSWWPSRWRLAWATEYREINPDAPLHPTVLERFSQEAGVLKYGVRESYRPKNLVLHQKVALHYSQGEEELNLT